LATVRGKWSGGRRRSCSAGTGGRLGTSRRSDPCDGYRRRRTRPRLSTFDEPDTREAAWKRGTRDRRTTPTAAPTTAAQAAQARPPATTPRADRRQDARQE